MILSVPISFPPFMCIVSIIFTSNCIKFVGVCFFCKKTFFCVFGKCRDSLFVSAEIGYCSCQLWKKGWKSQQEGDQQ